MYYLLSSLQEFVIIFKKSTDTFCMIVYKVYTLSHFFKVTIFHKRFLLTVSVSAIV